MDMQSTVIITSSFFVLLSIVTAFAGVIVYCSAPERVGRNV